MGIKYGSVYVLIDENKSYFVKPIIEADDTLILQYSEYLDRINGHTTSLTKSKKSFEYLLNNHKFKDRFMGIIEVPKSILESVGSDKKIDINFPFVEIVFTPKKNKDTGDVRWFLDYLVKNPKKEDLRDWRIGKILDWTLYRN